MKSQIPNFSKMLMVLSIATFLPLGAQGEPGQTSLRLGEETLIEGQPYVLLQRNEDTLLFSKPLEPMASLGAFITPVKAEVSDFQENTPRNGTTLIDGSGWNEYYPGSGVFVHTFRSGLGGASMWNTVVGRTGWVTFDLGDEYNVNGVYVWNFNGEAPFNRRGAKDVVISASDDGATWESVGKFTFALASGTSEEKGETIPFEVTVKARHFKFEITSNHGQGGVGLAEVRFANADEEVEIGGAATAKYPLLEYPELALGEALEGAENVVFPADFGHIDVTKAPYNAKGDGITDDTAAIQKALDDNPSTFDSGTVIYFPNGKYLVSDTLRYAGVNPSGGTDWKYTTLQGQSRDGTIIQLKDNASGFDDPRNVKPVIFTGTAPAQRFGNELCNFTVDTGVGNPGAAGLHFTANNQGGLYDVAVVSGDGHGIVGIDFDFTGENGPLLARNVKVVGFDTGINTARNVNSQTLENIELENQNVSGIFNGGQALSIRGLKSRNSVSALIVRGGGVTLENAELTGIDSASALPAILNEGEMWARDVKTTGYKQAIENRFGDKLSPTGNTVTEFQAPPPKTLFTGGDGFRLPVEETPIPPFDAPENWVSVATFQKDGLSDSQAIQAAMDAGKPTVYFPIGRYELNESVVIRGEVQHIIGTKTFLRASKSMIADKKPLFVIEDGKAPIVWIEGFTTNQSKGLTDFVHHNSKRTLVLQRVGMHGYQSDGRGGTLFLSDVVGGVWKFKNQNVWARQLNTEPEGTKIINDGGKLWILGLKTERAGTIIATKNSGLTEVFGGLVYTLRSGAPHGGGGSGDVPMFTIEDNSKLAAFITEAHYHTEPFQQFVMESRDGQTKEYGVQGPFNGQRVIVFQSHGQP